MLIILNAILGVIFFEAIRLYRCFIGKKEYIPTVGFNRKAEVLLYITVIIIFMITAISIAHYKAGDPFNAIVIGFAVPSGTRLLSPTKTVENTNIEDITSEYFRKDPSILQKAQAWWENYNT